MNHTTLVGGKLNDMVAWQTQMTSQIQRMSQHMVENKTLIMQNADAQCAPLRASARRAGMHSVSPVSRGSTEITPVYPTQHMFVFASANKDCNSTGCTCSCHTTVRRFSTPSALLGWFVFVLILLFINRDVHGAQRQDMVM